VITSGSSAALEAIVMGCSVIIMGNDNDFTFISMPEYGRGKIWDLVFDAEELKETLDRLTRYRQEHPGEIVTIAKEFREMFFTEATEQKYIELFDL
jgi:hypothetical protein